MGKRSHSDIMGSVKERKIGAVIGAAVADSAGKLLALKFHVTNCKRDNPMIAPEIHLQTVQLQQCATGGGITVAVGTRPVFQ